MENRKFARGQIMYYVSAVKRESDITCMLDFAKMML